jgi:hypothetical protein
VDITNIISIIVATFSLLVSIATAYLAYLRPAKSKMLIGRTLIIANTYVETESGKQWGGLSFILPFTFHNWSPIGSSIYQVRLIIERDDNPKNFDMIWSSFIRFMDGATRWESDTAAHPIAIAGQSSLTKFIRFDWSPFRNERLEIRPGKYNLKFYAWTKDSRKPNLKENLLFYLENEQIELYRTSVNKNLVIPIEILLGQPGSSNNLLTRDDVESKYG